MEGIHMQNEPNPNQSCEEDMNANQSSDQSCERDRTQIPLSTEKRKHFFEHITDETLNTSLDKLIDIPLDDLEVELTETFADKTVVVKKEEPVPPLVNLKSHSRVTSKRLPAELQKNSTSVKKSRKIGEKSKPNHYSQFKDKGKKFSKATNINHNLRADPGKLTMESALSKVAISDRKNVDIKEVKTTVTPVAISNGNNGNNNFTHCNSPEGMVSTQVILVSPPVAPPVICSNGKTECKNDGAGIAMFPCKRCHREFYCSEEHRCKSFERHQPECKTESSLEVIFYEEEYTIWHKHAASTLYDICLNFVLVWPSLTAQWLPDITELDNNVMRHKIILGTQTTGEANHLLICGIDIPPQNSELAHIARHNGQLRVLKRINHDGEIHRARYMPSNSNIIATKSPSSDVYIFDCLKYTDVPDDDIFHPSIRLRGHTKEGFGLAWNPHVSGRLLSGSSDGLVCLWDINATPKMDGTDRVIESISKLSLHTDVVEDVAWHHENENICASVGDDAQLIIWDLRVSGISNSVNVCPNAHNGDINAVNFSSFSEHVLATGSSDKTVGVWDLRNMNVKLHSLDFHKDEVMQVEWSPNDSTILASTGKDRRVFLWDIASINLNKDPMEDEHEGPKELTFIHGGHVASINDINWNHHEQGMIASVSDDNILQVWKTCKGLRDPDSSVDEEDHHNTASQDSSVEIA